MATHFNMIKDATYSQKFRRITALRKYMVDAMDNDQAIKRLMRYFTTTPLAKRGVTYDNKMIEQPDLTTSLKVDTEEGEMCLFTGMFDPDMETIYKNYIFIQHYDTYAYDDVMQTTTFYIYVLVDDKYNYLKNYGEERTYEIADRIAQLLDNHVIENEELVDEIGNIKFKIKGRISEARLSKTKTINLLTIPIEVSNSVMRAFN